MRPTSMTNSEPVTLPARSLASSKMRSATSCGWVNRLVNASHTACLATSLAPVPLARARAKPYLPIGLVCKDLCERCVRDPSLGHADI